MKHKMQHDDPDQGYGKHRIHPDAVPYIGFTFIRVAAVLLAIAGLSISVMI